VKSKTGSTRHVGYFWPIVPAPGDCEDGEFGGMKIGKGNRNTRRKTAPAQLCPQEIPLDQIRVRTRAAAVGSQRLTASAMARPFQVEPTHLGQIARAGSYRRTLLIHLSCFWTLYIAL
jgi:hypothetical protein